MSLSNRVRKKVDPDAGVDPELITRRQDLIARLNKGDAHIGAARREGKDTTAWENGWIRLLREYEEVCRLIVSSRQP